MSDDEMKSLKQALDEIEAEAEENGWLNRGALESAIAANEQEG